MRLSSFAKNAIVLGLLSAVGPFAIDMYLPALPTHRRRSARLDGRDADDADGLLRRLRHLPDRLRAGLGHGRPQAAALFRPRAVPRSARSAARSRPSIGWLIAFRFAPGHRRLRGDGDPARHHPRPAHRRRGDAADGARHAGLQRLADPGAAGRQRADRAVRLARRLRRRDDRRRCSASRWSRPSCPRRARPRSASQVSVGERRSAASASSCATAASSA